MSFIIRQFSDDQTLGEKLLTLRKAARFTLSELSAKTKIQKKILQAFEANAFEKLPDQIYARQYLKRFVRALGADETYFLDRFEQERGTCDFVRRQQIPRQRTKALALFAVGRWMKIFSFAFCAIVLMVYLGVQMKMIISAPDLSLISPSDGYLTSDATVMVKGKTDRGTYLTINGNHILLGQNGNFETRVALSRGLNILEIQVVKRYSRTAKIYRRVIFDEKYPLSLAP